MMSRRFLLYTAALPVLRGQSGNANMFGNAEAYERFMGRWSRLVAPLLVEFAAVPDSGRILDIGSGTGALAFAVAKQKPAAQVVGIDPSAEFIAYAAAKSPFAERALFQKGDAQRLHFPDATFTAALSLLVFNFIPDPVLAVREIQRVTQPKARISAAVWDYGDGMRMLRAFWDAAVETDPGAEKQDEKHMRLCRAGDLSKLWEQGGLRNVHEEPLEIVMKFDSFNDYWDPFLLGQGPAGAYVRTLAGDSLEALRRSVKRRLSVASEGKPFNLPARVWAVRGTVPNR